MTLKKLGFGADAASLGPLAPNITRQSLSPSVLVSLVGPLNNKILLFLNEKEILYMKENNCKNNVVVISDPVDSIKILYYNK